MKLEQVLDLARWAPSGDNTQPWRFSIAGIDRIAVHAFDTRDHVVYDLEGHASQLAVGGLLETIELAATRFGLATVSVRRPGTPDERPVFDVTFRKQPGLAEHPLVREIAERRVQRRAMSTRRLSDGEKRTLEQAVAPHARIVWFETFRERVRMTRLAVANAKIRLTLPEAYPTHRDTIAWNVEFSDDKMPSPSLGANPLTVALMKWAMTSWDRVHFLNRWLGGTVPPRIEMDLVPGLRCAAHVALVAPRPAETLDDYLRAGRAMQRFWLTASSLGLQMQPQYTPLVFSEYVRRGTRFTASPGPQTLARRVRDDLRNLLGEDADRAVFLARIGAGQPARSRSTRLPLDALMFRPDGS